MRPPVRLPPSDRVEPVGHLDRLAAGPFAGCELRADPADTGWIDAARATGWRERGVRERWRGALRTDGPNRAFVPLAVCGERAFRERLAAVLAAGDSHFGTDADALIDGWAPRSAGEDALWGLVGEHGIVVPRVTEPGVGGMLFVGIVPGQRGQRLGGPAYHEGLCRLASVDVTHVEDEIAAGDLAMQRILRQAGLQRTESWRAWIRG